MVRCTTLVVSLFFCAGPGLAFAAEPGDALSIKLPVEKYQLKNGLTVLLLEDHTVPMISYHTWYKVGSRDEKEGITGSAHMLEHMMFQGAKKYGGKDFHRLMQENGIEWNAFTTYDYTGFYMNLPSDKIDLVMDVEVDRMSSLAIDEKNLTSEREVVKEERRWRVDNNPTGLLFELTMSTVFRKSPYHWPVIGWMKDIAKYDPKTLRHFYETYYVPNNAVLVIAGDFDTGKIKKQIESVYGVLPFREVPPRVNAAEPPQTVQYNAKLRKDVQSTSFNVAYQGVPEGHEDMYALDLAATALGVGSSSRLNRRLVYQKEIATGASAMNFGMQNAGLFGVSVTMKPGLPMNDALDIVYNEVYKLRQKPLSEEELKKARTIKMKSFVDGLRTIDAKAQALAATEIITGSYENLLRDLPKYEKVTAADVQRVANKYLNQTQRSIVVLEPRGGQP
ncbi:MAG: insulinase family protein [Bdellovibrionaceae bacterium]|nr:insulinase family protein [Pseudobdellovibrionaceae bacterium]MBX3033110.1 insulinase family protein [Pseudobdellovibrionaceae bacterium]